MAGSQNFRSDSESQRQQQRPDPCDPLPPTQSYQSPGAQLGEMPGDSTGPSRTKINVLMEQSGPWRQHGLAPQRSPVIPGSFSEQRHPMHLDPSHTRQPGPPEMTREPYEESWLTKSQTRASYTANGSQFFCQLENDESLSR